MAVSGLRYPEEPPSEDLEILLSSAGGEENRDSVVDGWFQSEHLLV
jgi:hypothetical protein